MKKDKRRASKQAESRYERKRTISQSGLPKLSPSHTRQKNAQSPNFHKPSIHYVRYLIAYHCLKRVAVYVSSSTVLAMVDEKVGMQVGTGKHLTVVLMLKRERNPAIAVRKKHLAASTC